MTILFQHLGLPEHARSLAEMLHDYDPNLFLERLPNGHPWLIDNPDKPYAVIHRGLGMQEYIIESYSEDRLDHRVFANTVFGDAKQHNWNFDEFDPIAASKMLLEERRRAEEREEANLQWDYKMRQLTGNGKRVY